nr:hypothetical protein CFP56_17687 [Quercus suber]
MTAKCALSILGYLISVSFNALYAWDRDPWIGPGFLGSAPKFTSSSFSFGWEPLGILEMGYSDSSYLVPPKSLLGLSWISLALLGSRIFQALLPGVKDLLGFAGIEGVLSLVGIKDLLSFVGIKDLPGFAFWRQGSPRLCWDHGTTPFCQIHGRSQGNLFILLTCAI